MDTTFYILLSIKTPTGPESFAQFFIGNNRDAAYELFGKLKGKSEVDEKNVLYFDFMETKEGLPINLKLISCTLEEVAENCKLITKEVFKLRNLKNV